MVGSNKINKSTR